MKKFLCAIAMLLVFIPFVKVNAINETTNYYSYKKGQVVNFYPNSTTEANHNKEAFEVMIVEDKDTSDKFVKVWAMSFAGTAPGGVVTADDDHRAAVTNNFKTQAKNAYLNYVEEKDFIYPFQTGDENSSTNYFYDFDDANKGLGFITFDELKDMFGDKLSDAKTDSVGTYYQLYDKNFNNRNEEKVSFYSELETMIALGKAFSLDEVTRGFYLLKNNELWIAHFTFKDNTTKEELSGIVLRPATDLVRPDMANETFMYLPTMYANKTADCHETVSMCYVCNGEYKWAAVGSQDESCTEYKDAKTVDECKPKKCYKCVNENGKYVFKWVVPGTQSAKCEEVADITSKNDCTELVKTGVESHILEFGIVAALCVIALIVVKRKDLFKTI